MRNLKNKFALKRITGNMRDIFRGRNAKSHAPRTATVAEYHASTGFEALLGELFLTNNLARLYEICAMATDFFLGGDGVAQPQK